MLNYLQNASKEELQKDWEMLKKYNNYGPKADEVIDVVVYSNGGFVMEDDGTPLGVWCDLFDLQELREIVDATEKEGWVDANGTVVDEHVIGIEVIGNITDAPHLI